MRGKATLVDFLINQTTEAVGIQRTLFKSKAILMGSPTFNNGILVAVAAILEEIKGLKFKN
jgi:flavorubredoxin